MSYIQPITPYIDPARGDRVQTLLSSFWAKRARWDFDRIGQYDLMHMGMYNVDMISHLFSSPFRGILHGDSKHITSALIHQ